MWSINRGALLCTVKYLQSTSWCHAESNNDGDVMKCLGYFLNGNGLAVSHEITFFFVLRKSPGKKTLFAK